MSQIPEILDRRLDFDPDADFEKFLEQAPAKWAVYLLADINGEPVQLLCVKNLRQSLKRRLTGNEALVLTKRVEYRQIIRQIHWRRVDSALEADWVYHDVARQIFPSTYQGMTGFRPAWFVHVDPEAQFPRYAKTIDLTRTTGEYLGPLEDKHAAGKIIELVEDWFDLCRYYQILIQAPRGRACAYKEMGKCPAPCDGSISMDQYRRMIEWSAKVLPDPGDFLRDQQQRMRDAAADLRFETAGKIKAFADQISELGKGPWRHLRRLRDFAFVSLQRGSTPRRAKLFLILGGAMVEIAALVGEPRHTADLLRTILSAAENRNTRTPDTLATERIGIVTHHLFSDRKTHGVFIPVNDLSESSLSKAWRDLSKQKHPEETEGEGVEKELQAM